MKYDTDFFIKKLSVIPLKEWTVGRYTDLQGRHCALGHLGASLGLENPVSNAMSKLFYTELGVSVADVNDGCARPHDGFGSVPKSILKHKTPRARVLAGLNEIKKIQDGRKQKHAHKP